jgi:hypothetical protein
VTVLPSPCCDKIVGPWLQNHGCKVGRESMTTVVCVFDSHACVTSIMVSTWAAMADIKFHGDVIFLFSRVVVGCCRDNETCKCSAPRTYVENMNFSGKLLSRTKITSHGGRTPRTWKIASFEDQIARVKAEFLNLGIN